MSVTHNKTFENDFIINLIANFISESNNINYSYTFFEDFKKLGINLFEGQNYYVNSIEINSENFFDYLKENKNGSKLSNSIKISKDNLFSYQTPQFTKFIKDYFQKFEVKENIINANLFKERYNNNEDVFIFIESGNNQNMTFNNIVYYDSILSTLKFENGYFMIDKDTIDLKIYIKLIEKYNLKILKKPVYENIMFASSCKFLILSNDNNNFSYILRLISYYSLLFKNLESTGKNSPEIRSLQKTLSIPVQQIPEEIGYINPFSLPDTDSVDLPEISVDSEKLSQKKYNYIINLDRRHDRWESITKLIQSSPSLSKENFIRFSAFDAFDFAKEVIRFNIENHPIINDMKINNKNLKVGEIGCYFSHLFLLKEIMENNEIFDNQFVSIYEDDFDLTNSFESNYTIFNEIDVEKYDIDLLYSGGRFWDEYNPTEIDNNYFQRVTEDYWKDYNKIDSLDSCRNNKEQIIPHLYYRKKQLPNEIEWDRTTSAYKIKKSSCKKIYNLLIKNFIENCKAVDHVLISLHNDIRIYDYFPHLFRCHWNCQDTDIQNSKLFDSIKDCEKLHDEIEIQQPSEGIVPDVITQELVVCEKLQINNYNKSSQELLERCTVSQILLKISFIAFWLNFNYTDNLLINKFLKKYDNIEITTDTNNTDILIVGSFINTEIKEYIENLKIKNPKLKIVLCITEPIGKFFEKAYEMFLSFPFDKIFGCINNDNDKRIKYPLYLFDIEDKNIYSKDHCNDYPDVLSFNLPKVVGMNYERKIPSINNYVKNINIRTLITKDFCCLINKHDDGNTRGNIYYLLNQIKLVTCPGKLFNNCSNDELNKIGNIEYIKKFVFNICSENFKTQFPGYITEKLFNACLGGAIPIYFGSFDEVDEKIFNKNRIIFYNAYDNNSLINIYNLVKDLYNNPEKLLEFYRQPIFQDTSYETIINMIENADKMFYDLIYQESEEHVMISDVQASDLSLKNTEKKIIGFHTDQISERGTEIAVYDYAYYNEKLYGNKSIIFYHHNNINTNFKAVEKFNSQFECYGYNKFEDIQEIVDKLNIKYFYNIKNDTQNKNQKIKNCINLNHAVFRLNPHGDKYASISEYLCEKYNINVPVVPHMINLPNHTENMRNELNISNEMVVIGRYGGFGQFDINIAHEGIIKILELKDDIIFVFANTRPFHNHPRIIYLDTIIDLYKKVKYINTCDAMIHARSDGETFGLSIGEFSTFNKPVITTSGYFNCHFKLLGDKGLYFHSVDELVNIFMNIENIIKSRSDWNAYKDYSPEKVMKQFMKVFLDID
jgi:GR25 family glycosyltransferase involved in LPS biosynthesis